MKFSLSNVQSHSALVPHFFVELKYKNVKSHCIELKQDKLSGDLIPFFKIYSRTHFQF